MGTSDEQICMTRTVCRTIVLVLSWESDQCIMRYTDSNNDKEENRDARGVDEPGDAQTCLQSDTREEQAK